MPPQVVAAQLVHAAGETGPTIPGTHAVVLGVENEEELYFLQKQLEETDIPHHTICEPDEPYFGSLMAIGLYPIERNRISPAGRSILRKLSLYTGGGKHV